MSIKPPHLAMTQCYNCFHVINLSALLSLRQPELTNFRVNQCLCQYSPVYYQRPHSFRVPLRYSFVMGNDRHTRTYCIGCIVDSPGSPGFLDIYPQLNRVRLKISALTNIDMGNNILKVPKLPRLGFCINCH